jgi:Rad3-related DNA helicase
MGGIFSEGIDLTEEKLIGAIIVGTGLPRVCTERDILKQYFDGRGLGGFDYAYLYPGMNKVLQSAGRVIRTATDKGCVLLLDERFERNEYKKLFPREWKQPVFGNISDLPNVLENFWKD